MRKFNSKTRRGDQKFAPTPRYECFFFEADIDLDTKVSGYIFAQEMKTAKLALLSKLYTCNTRVRPSETKPKTTFYNRVERTIRDGGVYLDYVECQIKRRILRKRYAELFVTI